MSQSAPSLPIHPMHARTSLPDDRTPQPAESDELFRFCVRNANPELWRTTIPLIVRRRCQYHSGLIQYLRQN